MSYILDPEEQEILDAIEKNGWTLSKNQEEERKKTAEIVANTLQERQSINIRLPKDLLFSVKRAAQKKGMPYQTLIISTLHQEFLGEKNAA